MTKQVILTDLGNDCFLETFEEAGISYESYYFNDNGKLVLHREDKPAFITYFNNKVVSESYYYLGELQSSRDYDSNGNEF